MEVAKLYAVLCGNFGDIFVYGEASASRVVF
jgi:hypothetical protein